MNNISLHTAQAHISYRTVLTVLSLTTVTQLQNTVLQHPTTIPEQPKFYNVQLRRANIQITKHLTLVILLVMVFLSLEYCVMVAVLKSVLMYDGDMRYANLPHCVTNLHNYYLLSGISIFQFLFLILGSFKGSFILLLSFEYTTYRNYEEKSGGNISQHI